MKKIIIFTAVIALTLSLGITAFAASPHAAQAQSSAYVHHRNANCAAMTNSAFVDADNNGVCDNLNTNCNFVDANGDEICDNRGTHCSNFVDADNDGVCDNCKNLNSHNGVSNSTGSTVGTASGFGYGQASHNGGHHGRNHS